jgi:hypothetical protein
LFKKGVYGVSLVSCDAARGIAPLDFSFESLARRMKTKNRLYVRQMVVFDFSSK